MQIIDKLLNIYLFIVCKIR